MHWTTERAAAVAGLSPAAFLAAMVRKQCIDEDYRVDPVYWQRAGEPLWDAELVTKWAERRVQRGRRPHGEIPTP